MSDLTRLRLRLLIATLAHDAFAIRRARIALAAYHAEGDA